MNNRKFRERQSEQMEQMRDRAWESSKEWERRYYAEHQRIVDLALKHSPRLRATNEDGLPGFAKSISLSDDRQPEFSCSASDCVHFWPCPTYLWATGSEPFKVTIGQTDDLD